MEEIGMNTVYSLMSYDWESTQEWLFTCEKDISQKNFEVDVDFLIQKYKNEYFKSKKGTYVSGYGLLSFISTKLPELGYVAIKPICYSFDGNNVLSLKEEITQLQTDYLMQKQLDELHKISDD